ncbi:MAG: S1 RNA-binding domain-containing protein, partial [Merismopedia sp. SIO2A8]|nr:S1 RNA-binding domain-containing protein [Merismopedia sp. SIO2A8]
AFIDIGGVSGLLQISEISHDHIDTPHSVFNVNDEISVMIIDLDAERGRISLSTKQLEPERGDMVKNPDLVYDKAEEMAAKYREKMFQKSQPREDAPPPPSTNGAAPPSASAEAPIVAEKPVLEEEIPSAQEEPVVEEYDTPDAVEESVAVEEEIATDGESSEE